MVKRNLHHHFPHDAESRQWAQRIEVEMKTNQKVQLTTKRRDDIENDEYSQILARSYMIRCFEPQPTRSLREVIMDNEINRLWNSLIKQCRSTNTHTLWDVYQPRITVKMNTTESYISYLGRIQEFILRLKVTDYDISEAHKWEMIGSGLLGKQ